MIWTSLNEGKRRRSDSNTWYGWLISYIPETTRKTVDNLKDKVENRFKTNTPKNTVYRPEKELRKPKTQNQSAEKIIQSTRNPFKPKKEKN